jgi:hypothetical protein
LDRGIWGSLDELFLSPRDDEPGAELEGATLLHKNPELEAVPVKQEALRLQGKLLNDPEGYGRNSASNRPSPARGPG